MRKGAAIVSGILHLLLIALMVFGLPQFARPLPEPEIYSVEIVDVISERANPAPPQRVKTPIPPAPTTKPLPPAEELHET
ncbi:MAG: energy transducer TonB, partial [Zavarzinia sp.]